MINTIEDENERVKNFVLKALKISEPSKKSMQQIVQSVVVDFIVNWNEIDRELSYL
jgi:hypothetical protein